jgi:hypothetical protein
VAVRMDAVVETCDRSCMDRMVDTTEQGVWGKDTQDGAHLADRDCHLAADSDCCTECIDSCRYPSGRLKCRVRGK